MALNFPDNPSVNDIYRDSTSGFAYQWDGVVWQSYSDSSLGQIKVLDDISGSFNGSTQTFALTSNSTAVTPANAQQVRVVLGGVVQDPANDYTVSSSNITFTTPPAGALSFSGIVFGTAVPINTILDGSVTPVKLSTGGPTWNTSGDVNIAGIVTATSASIGYDNVGINSSGISVTGVITATSFVGDVTGTASTATASGVSYGLEGTPNIVVGIATVSTKIDVSGNYTQTVNAVGALDIDCSTGNYFTKTINGNSTFTFSNVPASRAYSFTLELTHTSGTVTWPTEVKWPDDTTPTLTTGKTHLFIFVTDNGGSRWRGAALVDYVN